MANTKVTKTSTGDSDNSNRTGATLNKTAPTAALSLAFTLRIGSFRDAKNSIIKLNTDGDVSRDAVIDFVDSVTIANVANVKSIIFQNLNTDVTALSQADKNILVSEFFSCRFI